MLITILSDHVIHFLLLNLTSRTCIGNLHHLTLYNIKNLRRLAIISLVGCILLLLPRFTWKIAYRASSHLIGVEMRLKIIVENIICDLIILLMMKNDEIQNRLNIENKIYILHL